MGDAATPFSAPLERASSVRHLGRNDPEDVGGPQNLRQYNSGDGRFQQLQKSIPKQPKQTRLSYPDHDLCVL